MSVDHPPRLQDSHEETDTLLAFYLANSNGNVLIRASDTDVIVIPVGQMQSGRETPFTRVIMECGSGNHRRHIDVTAIVLALESMQHGLAAALPGLHAMTGCDVTAAMYRKGKVKPLDILMKDSSGTLVQFFSELTSRNAPDQAKVEEFICILYGFKGDVKDVNEARYLKLLEMTGNINKESPMSNVKKIDCALLPPCRKTVVNKLKRAHYVTMLWGHADSADPGNDLDPLNYGWKLQDGCYAPDWFCGSAVPDVLFQGAGLFEGNQGDRETEETEYDEASESEPSWSSSDESDSEMY